MVETVKLEELEKEKANFTIIKRDGSEEPYLDSKMRRVSLWACDNDEYLTDELLRDTEIKTYDKIKIVDLYDELIKTAVNKISMLYPQWEYVAAKLYLMKVYKETWHINNTYYPNLADVIKKGISSHIYKREVFETFNDDEVEILNKVIKQKEDFRFTYKALHTFVDKYCLNYSKTKKLELPQIAYMRVAMFLHHQEKDDRIKNIIKTYKNISQHKYTLATPIMINAGTINSQLASCVLNKIGDDTVSIMDTIKNLGVYSKFKGGTALDVSELRSKGSYILGNQGNSSGPVPFIKIVESTMKSFNQGGKRPGSCCVYFQWWHVDVEDLIVLKSNGGTDENRARGLKYAVKINDLLIKRVINDKDITLLDPKDAHELIGLTGKEFEERYVEFENKTNVRRKRIKARDLWFKIMKERTETGNIYLFHEENVNNANMTGRYVNSSNLCTEILEPSIPSKLLSEELITSENGERYILKKYESGEIALCNLASVNLVEYGKLNDSAKDDLIYDIVSTMDNTIDIAHYPVKEGMNSNKRYRYLGIGVNNFANYLASNKIVIDTQEALEETSRLFDELSFKIISASNRLAIERGRFEGFYETEWARGNVPLSFANKKVLELTEYQPDMDKWNDLIEKIKLYGVRNCLLMAIAPTATSGKAQNSTESIEPIQNIFYKEEGTSSIPTLVPNFRKNNKYYKKAFDCDQMKLVELAAIRQMYLDQSQSVNLYFSKPDSLLELTKVHLYAFELSVKTLYYLKQKKGSDDDVCESCS